MPQAPSPNMQIIWPSDHDDADQWDVIMDTAVRVVIDGHNHSAGGGAKISLSSLLIDSDVSWVDAGGGKHAIFNLKAIDFFPVPTSDVTGFSGALFLNSADNELYYRTTGGANVKFTTGATLNVAGFTGGFGGDYGSVGALAVFDDGTDAYWFNQQVGAAVRQWAKMQCSDIRLFEFKAVGVSPVPNNNITLKVPAALANTFTLTLPGALPVGAAAAPLTVDASGNIAAGILETISVAANIGNFTTGTWTFGANGTVTCTSTGVYLIPIPLRTGDRVQSLTIAGFGDGAVDVVVNLNYVSKSNVATTKGTTNITNAPAAWNDTTVTPGAPSAMAAGDICMVEINPNASGFLFNNIRVTYDRP